jgi:hypothetical protein
LTTAHASPDRDGTSSRAPHNEPSEVHLGKDERLRHSLDALELARLVDRDTPGVKRVYASIEDA